MEAVAFFVGAIGALGGAIAVIALRNPFYSVLALIVHLVSLAGLFLMLYAEFVAAAQVVVYAGAVMVLYVFVAAYVGGVQEPAWEPIPGQQFLAPLLGDRAVRRAFDRGARLLAEGAGHRGADDPARVRLPGGDRPPAAGALPDRLRGRLDPAPARGRRRGRPRGSPPRRRSRR